MDDHHLAADIAREAGVLLLDLQARGATTIAYVPYLSRDVYDFSALREIGRILLTPSVGSRPHVTT